MTENLPPLASGRRWPRPTLGANRVTLLAAAWLASLCNLSLFHSVLATPEGGSYAFLAAVWLLLFAFNALLLSLLAWPGLHKPLLTVVLIAAAMAAFFMDSFGAVVDRHAVQSVLETNVREGSAWWSWRMAAYLFGLGLLPALALLWLRIDYPCWPRLLLQRAAVLLALLALLGAAVLPFNRELASLARNHGELRHLANPFNLVNALRGHAKHAGMAVPTVLERVGADAQAAPRHALPHQPLLLVLVVGESARASSFHLNGYPRATTPEMDRLQPVNFSHVSACGTNTATSVPCMFSNLCRAQFEEGRARGRENLLDVIARSGYLVEWEDNNTGSKHVADRQREEDLSGLQAPGLCQAAGCFDGILVEHLRAELAAPPADKVFVLHQIGSHGPAYYQRYPPEFERFTPSCRSNNLQDCTPEQIRNSYDNTILYTDHVLGELVRLLQTHAGDRDAALLYVSDHGESTGEHGLYLHGAPRLLAPAEQTEVPMLFWASESFLQWRGLAPQCLRQRDDAPLSHDNVFHSVLGLLDIRTRDYRRELDVFAGCTQA